MAGIVISSHEQTTHTNQRNHRIWNPSFLSPLPWASVIGLTQPENGTARKPHSKSAGDVVERTANASPDLPSIAPHPVAAVRVHSDGGLSVLFLAIRHHEENAAKTPRTEPTKKLVGDKTLSASPHGPANWLGDSSHVHRSDEDPAWHQPMDATRVRSHCCRPLETPRIVSSAFSMIRCPGCQDRT